MPCFALDRIPRTRSLHAQSRTGPVGAPDGLRGLLARVVFRIRLAGWFAPNATAVSCGITNRSIGHVIVYGVTTRSRDSLGRCPFVSLRYG
jgi:hypothetical protein